MNSWQKQMEEASRLLYNCGHALTANYVVKAGVLLSGMPDDPLSAENARLRKALEDCRKTLVEPNPGICCTVWFSPMETLLDRIDRGLGATASKPTAAGVPVRGEEG